MRKYRFDTLDNENHKTNKKTLQKIAVREKSFEKKQYVESFLVGVWFCFLFPYQTAADTVRFGIICGADFVSVGRYPRRVGSVVEEDPDWQHVRDVF